MLGTDAVEGLRHELLGRSGELTGLLKRLGSVPAEERPELYVFGESLGSFGGENAFSGEVDLANRTSGALFVGPPSFNPLYREFVDSLPKNNYGKVLKTELRTPYWEGRTRRVN